MVTRDARVGNEVEIDFVVFVGSGLEQFDLAAPSCRGLARTFLSVQCRMVILAFFCRCSEQDDLPGESIALHDLSRC